MLALRVLAVLLCFAYAAVNAVGAWAVVRRKPWLAGLFMLTAAVLTIAGVVVAYALREGAWLTAAGALLASAVSLANAQLVLGRVVPRFHLLRLAAGLVLIALVFRATSF